MSQKGSRRPKLKIGRSRLENLLEVVAIASLTLAIGFPMTVWNELPEEIPVDFSLTGQPSLWGSKLSIWLYPVCAAIGYLVMTVARFYPHTFNYSVRITPENARRQYQNALYWLSWTKVSFILTFGFVEWQTVRIAFGYRDRLDWKGIVVLLAIFLGVNFVYRHRRDRDG